MQDAALKVAGDADVECPRMVGEDIDGVGVGLHG